MIHTHKYQHFKIIVLLCLGFAFVFIKPRFSTPSVFFCVSLDDTVFVLYDLFASCSVSSVPRD